ncbi:MAG: glycoside hydrolase family 3 C-terminal domain-containing protein [Prevotella sp.]|jgi:beta-glucosidase|nr:glycoside hydrolase family 3 C-terminal domain-containing protein [Prevotella sp.]
MTAKTIILTLCTSAIVITSAAQPYKNPKLPVEKRISDLVSRMTLDEKILQLTQFTLGENDNINNIGEGEGSFNPNYGSFIYRFDSPEQRNLAQKKAMETRLGIPVLFGQDIIHGCRTIYPIPLAQACSWNPELSRKASEVAAKETRASGVDWTFSPMIDVARDGRWGRIAEGYGEDPYTTAVFAVAAVKGYQGGNPFNLSGPNRIAACLKHYVGYGRSEGGRDYSWADISAQSLWDTYLPPYEAGVKAGAATLMSAFNDISGVPASANRYTLTEVLKKQWKHDGFVISDWGAVVQLIAQGNAADRKDAALKAFTAGVEMDMVDNCYKDHLADLVKEGKVSMALIDDAVSRVLRVKFRLGLFENPYTPETTPEERYLLPEYRKIVEQLAEESIVLLKNSNSILPLADNAKKIALIGPVAKEKAHLLGSWAAFGRPDDVVSIYEAVQKELGGKITLTYAQGCDFDGNDYSGFQEALDAAKNADVVVLCLGEKREWSGENASRSTIALPEIQEQLAAELKKAEKPLVLALSNGRPLDLHKLEPLADAIVEIWQPGVAGGLPLAGVLSGRVNPSGKLAVTFPYSTGQIPVYYNERQRSRPIGEYQDIPTQPLYPFGYGLSYTDFQYGELKVSKQKIAKNETFRAEIPVTNAGRYDGMETVHWYISDPACSVTRPYKELKYFEKQLLKAGETKIFTFEIDPVRDLSFVNDKGEKLLEPGVVYILVKDKNVEVEITNK